MTMNSAKGLARRLLSSVGYRLESIRHHPRQLLNSRNLRVLELDDIIARRMLDVGQSLTFIQVGAFDGVTGDPLHPYIDRYKWRGVLLEPQPGPAAQLRKLYSGNERIVVLEAAVDSERRTRRLFTVESDVAPDWAGGMGSFDREQITKHAPLVPGLHEMIRERSVDCITFADILEHLSGEAADILQIDAEGADELILSLFPFERVKPAIVHWEIKNLTKLQRELCLERLSDFGYRFAPSGDEDMLAVLR
jgi:FkbM family methyltransferase